MTVANFCTATDCDRPVHDGWYICDPCAHKLEDRLTDTAWMLDQLDLVVSQQTRYAVTAGKVATVSDEQPIPFNVRAAEQRTHLVNAIATAARIVVNANPRWRHDPFWTAVTDRRQSLPNPTSCAAWLAHRITGLRLHPLGGQALDEINRHWNSSEWIIDRPPERRYLGICVTDWEGNVCGGRVYQHNGKPEARCDTCGGIWDEDGVDELRTALLVQLDAHTGTAADIAHLSTYLSLTIGRTEVRKLVNKWHERKRLIAVGEREGDPLFRLIEARALLESAETTRRTGTAS